MLLGNTFASNFFFIICFIFQSLKTKLCWRFGEHQGRKIMFYHKLRVESQVESDKFWDSENEILLESLKIEIQAVLMELSWEISL